jgi:hypothetical protein
MSHRCLKIVDAFIVVGLLEKLMVSNDASSLGPSVFADSAL